MAGAFRQWRPALGRTLLHGDGPDAGACLLRLYYDRGQAYGPGNLWRRPRFRTQEPNDGAEARSPSPPFLRARLCSTIDSLTRGRFGWNIVTSAEDLAAQNFGLDKLPLRQLRY